ncbi:MAG: mechanosensitive ion channel family protein [Gemmatimonadota bacterium]|nr:mechanosensitive ion channel family protein [Gemmatimonadota bacterium]MDH4349517.1 mechanosensitive ion channel family protein [Gemmatimonadota bacterium]MDH5196086.1 mechanosensitive ion channel family protein [Gemmatimonadota bacterium]
METTLRDWLYDPTVARLVTVGVGLVLIAVFVRAARTSLGRYIRDTDTRYRARKFVSFLGYVVAFVFLTVVFRSQLGGLTVALGVAGAGIAFALQEVIASVAGWVAVALGNFYKVGDRVQLGGIRGDVIDVGVLRTTIMECGQWVSGDLYNGRIVRVANSFVFKEPVFNYSGDFPFLWDEITVPIRYGSDHRLARQILENLVRDEVAEYAETAKTSWREMVRKYRIEDARVDPLVTLVANDNWMEFTVRYVVDYTRRRITKDRLFSRLLDAVDETGGRVALASATNEIVAVPELRVRLADGSGSAPAAP